MNENNEPENLDEFVDMIWAEALNGDKFDDMTVEEVQHYLGTQAIIHERVIFHNGHPFFDWEVLWAMVYGSHRFGGDSLVITTLNEINTMVGYAQAVRDNGPKEKTD